MLEPTEFNDKEANLHYNDIIKQYIDNLLSKKQQQRYFYHCRFSAIAFYYYHYYIYNDDHRYVEWVIYYDQLYLAKGFFSKNKRK